MFAYDGRGDARQAEGIALAAGTSYRAPVDIDAAIAVLRQGFVVESGLARAELAGVGEPAFDALIGAIETESDEDGLRELSRTFTWLRETVPLQRYADALTHRNSRVRSNAAYTLQMAGLDATPYAAALLPLLADPDAEVRQRAVWAFGGIGHGAVPVLQQVRRHGPGRLRAPALEALATIAGEDGLDERDRAAVQRLIRVKLVNEVPSPPHMCGSWLAVSTGDKTALMQVLDLTDPRPATMALGFSAVCNDQHHLGTDFETRRGRIFVTPRLGDWTLVFGGWAPKPAEYVQTAVETCERLSRRFGKAHAYGISCGDGWMSWCIAENGSLRRFYEADNPDTARGQRLPVEQGRLLPDDYDAYTDEFRQEAYRDGFQSTPPETWRVLKEKHGIPDDVDVLDVAAAMSVNPAAFGPGTPLSGQGLLTLNHVGRQHGVCPGALNI